MKFLTSETVCTRDPEKVLRALEVCLREVSSEVLRCNHEIILRGLGPSPISMNRNDVTVLRVSSEEETTVIRAEVTFQASALLGDLSQETVVHSKLNRVFEQLKSQLDRQQRNDQSVASGAVAGSSFEMPATFTVAAPTDMVTAREEESVAGPVMVAALPVVEEGLEERAPSTPHTARHESQEVEREESGSKPTRRRAVFVAVVVAVLLLLTAGAIYLLRSHPLTAAATLSPQERTVVSAPSTDNVGSRVEPLRVASPGDAALFASGVADPKAWLQEWAATMRSRDPVAQASFYADPVDRYLTKTNVGSDALVTEKLAAIENRKGLWTLRVDSIEVERQAGSGVTVHLVKHFMAQTGSAKISEQATRSRIELKRIDGQWKIISERDLP